MGSYGSVCNVIPRAGLKAYKEGGNNWGYCNSLLGGDKDGGIWNSVVQASKWGGIGCILAESLATFGPIGALVGGLLGIALGAVFGMVRVAVITYSN